MTRLSGGGIGAASSARPKRAMNSNRLPREEIAAELADLDLLRYCQQILDRTT